MKGMFKNWIAVFIMIFGVFSPAILFADITWTGCGISKKSYMSEMATAFEKKTGIKIHMSGGGATKGIRDTAMGKSDIGGTCRHLTIDVEESGIRLFPVAWDAIVVIVNPKNKISNISVENLKKVFSGQIKNWKELGGDDASILVHTREGKKSGVGMMGRELIFGNPNVDFASTRKYESSAPLEKSIEKHPHSIGLTGVSSAIKRDVKLLRLNDVKPTARNISTGMYKLYRPLYLVTRRSAKDEVKRFLKFVRSPQGQAVIASQGAVTLPQGQRLWKPYREHMKKVVGNRKGIFD